MSVVCNLTLRCCEDPARGAEVISVSAEVAIPPDHHPCGAVSEGAQR